MGREGRECREGREGRECRVGRELPASSGSSRYAFGACDVSTRRVLPPDRDGPRFRITRLFRVGAVMKAEVIGSEDTHSDAMRRVFAEPTRTMAVDRRGDIYADNHQPILMPELR